MSSRYDEFTSLEFDYSDDGIMRVIMNNPERLNAADQKMHRELADIWPVLDADPDVKCIIIKGAGKAFSAGGDLDMVADMADSFEVRAKVWREARDLVYNVINCMTPTVSAMRGPAVGAGLVAGLLSDISIASKTAKIIDGHTRLGVAAGDHAAVIWPLLIGMAKAKYYLMLCEPIGGEEAERIGLVSLCVEDDELDAKAEAVAQKLCSSSHTAVQWTKYSLNNWLRQAGPAFDASLALEFMGFAGPDVREGIDSIKGKRAPNFAPNAPF